MIRKCKNFDVRNHVFWISIFLKWLPWQQKKPIWWPPFFILSMFSEFLKYPLCEILSDFYFQFLRYEMRSYLFKKSTLFIDWSLMRCRVTRRLTSVQTMLNVTKYGWYHSVRLRFGTGFFFHLLQFSTYMHVVQRDNA